MSSAATTVLASSATAPNAVVVPSSSNKATKLPPLKETTVLLLLIFSNLDLKTQMACGQASRSWKVLSQNLIKQTITMISIFNKSIPSFIGYNYLARDQITKQRLAEHPELRELEPQAYLNSLDKHASSFHGTIAANGSITVAPIPRPNQLRAVALEFDTRSSDKEGEKLTSKSDVRFTVEITWKYTYGNYDGNYSQGRYFPNYPILYDVNTHSPFKRENLRITHIADHASIKRVLNSAAQFLSQCTIRSSTADENGTADAKKWSAPLLLLNGDYPYI